MAGEHSQQWEVTQCRARGHRRAGGGGGGRGGGVTAGWPSPPTAAAPTLQVRRGTPISSPVPSTSSHTPTVDVIQGTLLLTHLNYFSSRLEKLFLKKQQRKRKGSKVISSRLPAPAPPREACQVAGWAGAQGAVPPGAPPEAGSWPAAGPGPGAGAAGPRGWGAGEGAGAGSWGCRWAGAGGSQELGEGWRAAGRRRGAGAQAAAAGSAGRRAGGRAGGPAGRRRAAEPRRRGPRSSSWTAGSGSPPQTCRSCWWTSPSCSWRAAAAVAGAAAAAAGAQAPGGPEEGSGPWGGRRLPPGLEARPHPRRLRGAASGLEVDGLEAMEGEWARFWEF